MKLRPFELALVIIFGGLALVALVLLRVGPIGGGGEEEGIIPVGQVSIWGTLPQAAVTGVLYELAEENESYEQVSYRYFHPNQFDSVLVNALADGVGPDLILTSQEKLVEMRKRIQPISYESFPIRDIKNLYLDGAQIFALNDGMYGYPLVVDPLMMYWNRDILGTEDYLNPPETWEVLVNSMFPDLIERNFDRTITRSVVAMGEYRNVRNSFGIISTLLLQSGTAGVSVGENGGYEVRLQVSESGSGDPLKSAVDFYTRFSKPSNPLYSWNRSFAEDRSEFASQDLALYFGYGSEARQIERLNPNLNFDIAEIPQGASASVRRTYGKFYSLFSLQSSDNKYGSAAVMSRLAAADISNKIAVAANMAPVRRNLISQGSNDTYGRVIYKSAVVSLGWLNPNLEKADSIFATMTQDINENRRSVGEASSDASSRLGNEYR